MGITRELTTTLNNKQGRTCTHQPKSYGLLTVTTAKPSSARLILGRWRLSAVSTCYLFWLLFFWTSSCELLDALWLKKLHFHFYIYIELRWVRKWSEYVGIMQEVKELLNSTCSPDILITTTCASVTCYLLECFQCGRQRDCCCVSNLLSSPLYYKT